MQYPVFRSLIAALYPFHCLGCDSLLVRGEKDVCLQCLDGLIQYQNFEQKNYCVDHLFWGLAKVEVAFALFLYVKEEKLSGLIHSFKYRGNKDLGFLFSRYMIDRIENEENLKDVDGIIFVPMHRKKENKRGYNQAKVLAENIAFVTDVPVVSIIRRKKKSKTQTSKNVFDRHNTLSGNFEIVKQPRNYKHLLLIDDVVTTGATAVECINLVHQHHDLKISVLAIAHRDI